eukprot:c8237_g1_i2.p1 GENE.c8237_g1_i2~~c8237_g1_i2.p1  ORF type:complete len:378 (-),score=82.96 c8237_g1_i2:602-1735(-)
MFQMRLVILLAFVLVVVADARPARLNIKPDGTFKILHISDTHYEIPEQPCQNVPKSPYPCGHTNTTAFIRRLIAIEKPDLVVFTGDIVDWATNPSQKGMDELYGCAIEAGLPWAASLGNHDGQSNLNRSQVMEYIVSLNFSLSQEGPVVTTHTYGNFILEFFANASASEPVMRSYHFDSDMNDESINDAQVAWFKNVSAGSTIPSMAFYHIPLVQYAKALNQSLPISGSVNEGISFQPTDAGVFDAFLASKSVKVGYCGHNHVNDFCVLYNGIQLCYEGSPGYQAYGLNGFVRRARVTELREWGRQIVTWKRLDDANSTVINHEVLWSADETISQRYLNMRSPVSWEEYEKLPYLEQPGRPRSRPSMANVLDPTSDI